MTAGHPQQQEQVVECAAAALSRWWRTPVILTDVAAISDGDRRNIILRATASCAAMPSRSVIIKAQRTAGFDSGTPNAFGESGLVREWTACAFLASHSPQADHCPNFLAGDAARGVVVFDDLGADLTSLVGPLLDGPATRAAEASIAYAGCIGRLHAATLDCAAKHAAALHRFFPNATAPQPANREQLRTSIAKVQDLLGGGTIDATELAVAIDRLAQPGPWLGLAHRDPCPDNVLLIDGRARLLDFEFASPGHILLDACYWRMGFPTCWCAGRVPIDVQAAMDDVYRRTLVSALPDIGDDATFRREM